MTFFVTYNALSGEIASYGSCQAIDLELQSNTGHVLEGVGNFTTHYVAAGALVAYSPVQAAAKQNRPAYLAQWSNTAMQWSDLRTLADLKLQRWSEVKAERSTRIDAPLVTALGTFDAAPEDRANLMLALQNAQAGNSFEWTLTDNSTVTLTLAQMTLLGRALSNKVAQMHATARALRAQIDAATTAAQVEQIAWPAT